MCFLVKKPKCLHILPLNVPSDSHSVAFSKAFSLLKEWQRQKPLAPLASVMGVKNLTKPSKPYARQMFEAFGPLFEENEDMTLIESNLGGGGVKYGLRPERHIGVDINPALTGLHTAIRDAPQIFNPEAMQDLTLTREGEIPIYSNTKTPPTPVGGPVTSQEIEQFGMPDLGGVYYGINYYNLRRQFNELQMKKDMGTITPAENVKFLQLAYYLSKNAFGQSMRYNRKGEMTQGGPRPRGRRGFKTKLGDIAGAGQVNLTRFGGSKSNWMSKNKLNTPEYYAAGHLPYGVLPEDTEFKEYNEAAQNSKIYRMPMQEMFQRLKMPDNAAFLLDPPYRGQEGLYFDWKNKDSDYVGQVFRMLANRGTPVAWYDSAMDENTRMLEGLENAGYAVTGRAEGNQKAKKKTVPEMFAFANMPHLDPDDVASWSDSRGLF